MSDDTLGTAAESGAGDNRAPPPPPPNYPWTGAENPWEALGKHLAAMHDRIVALEARLAERQS